MAIARYLQYRYIIRPHLSTRTTVCTHVDRNGGSRTGMEGATDGKCKFERIPTGVCRSPSRCRRVNYGESICEDLAIDKNLSTNHLCRKSEQRNECEQHASWNRLELEMRVRSERCEPVCCVRPHPLCFSCCHRDLSGQAQEQKNGESYRESDMFNARDQDAFNIATRLSAKPPTSAFSPQLIKRWMTDQTPLPNSFLTWIQRM